ncbi:MAG TPA: ferredoxin [Candidatus Binataceae bacterium]
MKVIIDRTLCEGNGRCVEFAPELFEVAADDKAHLLIEEPPEPMRAKVELAVRLCPRQAISIK